MREPLKPVDSARWLMPASRRAPTLAAFVTMVIAEWRALVDEVSRAIAGQRRNRAALENELFGGHYKLSSKNDDDLPVP